MRDSSPVTFNHGPLTVYIKPLEDCPDLGALVRALPSQRPVIWFDSARHHPVTGRWSMVGFDPWLTLRVKHGRVELSTSSATHVWQAHPLVALRQVLHRYRAPAPSSLRLRLRDPFGDHPAFAGWCPPQGRAIGLMGFLSYDLNRWIERLSPPRLAEPTVPDMLWFGMRTIVLVDHAEQRSWLLSVADPNGLPTLARREAVAALERADTLLGATPAAQERPLETGTTSLEATSTQQEFHTMVLRALEHIRAGDIIQANLSQRFTASWRRPALPLYETLRRINPSPFSCLLSSEEVSVVSCSPERLVRVQDGRVDTRPIAGTRPRGATPGEDAVNSLDLLLSEKERAEHIMLVDLARNDLGRISAVGSVSIGELMALEAYSHVIHIVSDVSGVLRPGVDAVDVIRAVFPGGTITGCPKVRCMQILRELEPVARGLYTGSLGYLGFDGTMDLNIAIRTIAVQDGRLSFHVGAGIVADSDPEREYHETLAKAGALVNALRSVDGQMTDETALRAQSCGHYPKTPSPEPGALFI